MKSFKTLQILQITRSGWFYVVFFIFIFILINIRQNRIDNYGCEICADKAGYYMYLPAVFYLGFKAENYPEGFHEQVGKSIIIDRQNNKVITKYTCGLALLWAPFYSLGALIAKVFSLDIEPYSYYYLFFINIGAALFALIGLLSFRKWLENYVDPASSLITMLVTFFGTHLYYYTLDESLMSHMYGFSLFAISLFSIKSYLNVRKLKFFLIFSLSISFAISIRPTNALFVLIILFLDVNSWRDLYNKTLSIISPLKLLVAAILLVLILLPQLIYWKFAFDKYIMWTYQGEGFTNWSDPRFGLTWFSPQSGLFIYAPILLIPLIYSMLLVIKKFPNATLILISFLLVSYMCASWSNPTFGGCNFGKRPMVEYLPIFMFPFAIMLHSRKELSNIFRYLLFGISIIFTSYSLLLFAKFNTCFHGNYWEWSKFWEFFRI